MKHSDYRELLTDADDIRLGDEIAFYVHFCGVWRYATVVDFEPRDRGGHDGWSLSWLSDNGGSGMINLTDPDVVALQLSADSVMYVKSGPLIEHGIWRR